MGHIAKHAVAVAHPLNSTLAARQTSRKDSSDEPATNYLFVDNVRFLAMAAVVCMHCISGFAPVAGTDPSGQLVKGMIQPFKFGTIGFFLISGFLMGEGLNRRPPLEYMKRRLRTVFTPWLLWFSLLAVKTLAVNLVRGRFAGPISKLPTIILRMLNDNLFGTAYWFVPNLLVALCVLLLFRRVLYDIRVGCAFLIVSLAYGLNIYAQWFALSSHTQALFGFVFYLWLGAWASHNHEAVQEWIRRISMPSLVALVVLAGLAAIREEQVLTVRGVLDSMNTLRISNQLYSILVVMMIVKVHRALSPRVLNVRMNTFGIYLSHTIVLSLLLAVSRRTILAGIADHLWGRTPGVVVCLSLAGFAATYGCSLAVTWWLLAHPRLRWTVGAFEMAKRVRTFESAAIGGSTAFHADGPLRIPSARRTVGELPVKVGNGPQGPSLLPPLQ